MTTQLPSAARSFCALAAVVVPLCALYYWTAIPRDFHLSSTSAANEHYNLLAQGLLAGRTSLLVEPRPELLALADPYDPIKNHQVDAKGQYCLHDVAFYRGKYYLYYGVTPAAALLVPYHLVTGQYLPTSVAALVFALGGMIASTLLLNFLVGRFYPAAGPGTRWLLLVAVGCCNCVLYVLRSPHHWELAIISAYGCSMAGLYFLARGWLGDGLRRGSMAWGSLFLGLAIGCRPNMALVALPIFAVAALWSVVQLRRKLLTRRDLAGLAAALVGPWLLCVLLLGAYNRARFGSFTEFGIRYNLVGATVRVVDMPVLDRHRLGMDLYCYLCAAPRFLTRFPYVRLERPIGEWTLPGYFGFEQVAGLLASMPFLWVLALLPVTLYRAWKSGRYGCLAALTVCLGAGVLELVCVSCFGESMRYMVDFTSWFVFAAVLVVLDLEAWSRGSWIINRSIRFVTSLGVVAACLFHIGISIDGQRSEPQDVAMRNELRQALPRLPLPCKSLKVRAEVVFPEDKAAGLCEPLVVAGKPSAGDFVYARYLGGNEVAFTFLHYGAVAQEGAAVQVVPGRLYTFEADLLPGDCLVTCRLQGEEVLKVETPLLPIERHNYWIGTNTIPCGLFTSDVFSGTMRPESVHTGYFDSPGPAGL